MHCLSTFKVGKLTFMSVGGCLGELVKGRGYSSAGCRGTRWCHQTHISILMTKQEGNHVTDYSALFTIACLVYLQCLSALFV